ncbi:hypothetical protein DFP79_1974 [Marinomonas balearica]|uniref:Uncharacterized protein n=1 Tax=Marinomonas balearica TaxID=491947 RepID=A0A4R6MA56_9GAMM|nr:hypothetical protein DFP79_1974 [Marinomonas balearica]
MEYQRSLESIQGIVITITTFVGAGLMSLPVSDAKTRELSNICLVQNHNVAYLLPQLHSVSPPLCRRHFSLY